MQGWLPYGIVLVLLLGLSICLSFAWLSRPSGRAGLDRRPPWQRLMPLAVLLAPLLLFAGFVLVLFPIGPPQLVILRSQAFGVGVAQSISPCLEAVITALGAEADESPPCITDHLPEPEDIPRADPRLAVARSALLSLDHTDVLLQNEAFNTAIVSAVASVPGVSAESNEAEALAKALALESRWWLLARRAQVVDAGPVVQYALDIFSQTHFGDEAYADPERNAELVVSLQNAVERAISDAPPKPLDPGTLPSVLDPNPRSRPEIVEAMEIAVLRLLAARNNVKGLLVEYHGRVEDDVPGEAWRKVARTLASGSGTSTAAPVGLALFPGSATAPSRLLRTVGAPWRRVKLGGDVEINVTFALGAVPVPDWKIRLRRGPDPAAPSIDFSCVNGSSSGGEMEITSCLRYATQLKGGDTVLTTLTIPFALAPPRGSPLYLEVSFEPSLGLQPLRSEVLAEGTPPSIAVEVTELAGAGGDLSRTLSCIISSSPVASTPSIDRFHRLLAEAGKAGITQGAGGARIRLDPSYGIWVYPSSLKWSRIENELMRARIDQRPHNIDDLLSDPAQLRGAALFPFALPAQGLPDGMGARAPVPLAPQRDTELVLGGDPASGLRAPPSFRFPLPYAEPVVFTHLPRKRATSSIAVFPIAAAPVAWRIALPPTLNNERGGIVWYFGFDPVRQGLLLDANCLPPEAIGLPLLCGPPEQAQIYEPVYEEARFFPVWLWLLRAARESAVAWEIDTPIALAAIPPPVFISDDMLARARVASASTGLTLLLVGLSIYAAFVIAIRLRQNL